MPGVAEIMRITASKTHDLAGVMKSRVRARGDDGCTHEPRARAQQDCSEQPITIAARKQGKGKQQPEVCGAPHAAESLVK